MDLPARPDWKSQIACVCLVAMLAGGLGPAQAAQTPPDTGGPAGGADTQPQLAEGGLELDPAARDRLRELGWPPAFPAIPPRDDVAHRRRGEPVTGSLQALGAFATITRAGAEVRIPRDDIGLIVLNGKALPTRMPPLPLDKDAVVLSDGSVLSGTVNVAGQVISVAGRSLQQEQAVLIRLLDPQALKDQPPQFRESDRDAGDAASPGAGQVPGPTAPPGARPPAPPGGGGGATIPWGEALWLGTLSFDLTEHGGAYVDKTLTMRGTYEITWKEEAVWGRKEGDALPQRVKLRLTDLRYQYDLQVVPDRECEPFSHQANGANLQGMGWVTAELELSPGNESRDRTYSFHIEPYGGQDPSIPKTCPGRYGSRTPVSLFGSSLPVPSFSWYANSLSAGAAGGYEGLACRDTAGGRLLSTANYQTLAGAATCTGARGTSGRFTWRFERGALPTPTRPTDVAGTRPCTSSQSWLAYEQHRLERAAAELRDIRDAFREARQGAERLEQTKARLQEDLNTLIVAAAASEVGQKLLELVLGDAMLKTAVAEGSLTKEAAQLIAQRQKFVGDLQKWMDFLDDPNGWLQSKLKEGAVTEAGLEGTFDSAKELLDFFEHGQVLADALGLGDGQAALEYIEDNLGKFGPLVPEDTLQGARAYVDIARQWAAAQKTMLELAGRASRLVFEVEEASLNLAARLSQSQAPGVPC